MSIRPLGIALLALALLASTAGFTPAFADATGAAVHSASGKVVDANSGLPLAGVKLATEGPTAATTTTRPDGTFTISGLASGEYSLIATRSGYETTASEIFIVGNEDISGLTLAIARTQGSNTGSRVLGRTTVRASQSLQKAATISRTVSAQSLAQQGYFRTADYLQQLPGLVGGNPSQPGDDVSLDIRGIGTLETLTLIDGHPIGPRGDYNYELSPVFGLSAVNVFYGSGGSDLYGVNAIGGVVNMETLSPTITPQASFSQSFGTFDKLSSAIQDTGSVNGGKLGYAFAYGTQGLDGPFHHDVFYQASAAFDQYATDPAVHATGMYQDDNSFINRSGLAKFVWTLNPTTHVTAAYLGSSEWDDKTGNGDNDFLPYQVELAAGKANLAAAAASGGSDSCYNANPATFTVNTANGGLSPGMGPFGPNPDGGSPCQTPQSFARANYGYQGAGPAWQGYHSNDYHIRLDSKLGPGNVVVDTFSNFYYHNYNRTFERPLACGTDSFGNIVYPCGLNPSWHVDQDVNTGATISDDFVGTRNDFGAGFFWENTASLYRSYSWNTENMGAPANLSAAITSPVTHDDAFFLRDAYQPQHSDLTTYLNVWFKHSTITNTSYVDPRIAFVWSGANNVWRVAAGGTSTQPTPAQLDQPFSPNALGAFTGGGVSCTSFNSVGNVPSSALIPEKASDMELSYGHRFNENSSAQLTFYNTNVFDQIYGVTVPLSSVSTPGFNPIPYANAVQGLCPGLSQAQALALLGLSGNANIGHTLARGIELTGTQHLVGALSLDYTYDTQSAILESNTPSLINPADGGNLSLIPQSQLPAVPLHKYSYTFAYDFEKHVEARLATYHLSENNQNNLPAYGYSDFDLSVPAGGQNLLSVNINNVFQSHANYENQVGLGYPSALNHFASVANGDYAPYFGSAASERFNLPYRTIEFIYSLRAR
ncbi:MAG TPA: TonB-dependent receptor [Candidatus Eremiobacteraceae bacterium]|nr:TonB-dependent receptor [Candidatus Eremiobacteraceae bacterium]